VINTDHHQKPACAGCIGLRSRPRPHAVVEHSKITTASASPCWGRFFDIRLWPFKVLVEGDHAIADFRWQPAMVPVAVAASQRSYPPVR
jgi:hypothetical protein